MNAHARVVIRTEGEAVIDGRGSGTERRPPPVATRDVCPGDVGECRLQLEKAEGCQEGAVVGEGHPIFRASKAEGHQQGQVALVDGVGEALGHDLVQSRGEQATSCLLSSPRAAEQLQATTRSLQILGCQVTKDLQRTDEDGRGDRSLLPDAADEHVIRELGEMIRRQAVRPGAVARHEEADHLDPLSLAPRTRRHGA